MRYIIDGTDKYGCYAGDAKHGPYVVFSPDSQTNVAGPFRYRWLARLWIAFS